jgi:hypothetical protein
MFKDSEITGGLRKVYTESFVIRVSRKVYCWSDHVKEEVRGACKVQGRYTEMHPALDDKSDRKKPLWRPVRRREHNVKMNLKRHGVWMEWIGTGFNCRAVLSAEQRLLFLIEVDDSWRSEQVMASLKRMTLHIHVLSLEF